MRADAKRRLTIVDGILLNGNRTISVEGIREDDLLRARVDAELLILGGNLHELLVVVATIDAEALEEVGKVLREVHREDVPAEAIIEERSKGSAEGVAPRIHRHVVGHLRPIHAGNSAHELMGHRAYGREVVLHGEVHVARAYEATFPLA